MDKIELAEQIVKSSFKGKDDKGGEAYFKHCYRVRNAIKEEYQNEDVQCIALLHDLIEDCPEWNEDSIRHLFGDRVAKSVQLLTRQKNQSYDDYIQLINESGDGFAISVKVADLIDNMNVRRLKELTQKDFERLQKYHKAYKLITE